MTTATINNKQPANFGRKFKFKSFLKLAQPRGPIVETHNGALEGRRVQLNDGRTVNVFLGIPYAKPPVGDLRFRKPVALDDEKWEGVRSARRYGPRAIQRDFFWDLLTEMRVGKSEDCLSLNVMAPAAPPDPSQYPNGYAVMVYIHGGGFVMDSAAKYHYRNIARSLVRHDVIVVTIQYRLSYLGFFCTGDENAVGNYGLWDQVLALRWVRANIASFGGDSRRVTVFGQSAGAVSADLLSISPVSRDLVDQVIVMGGNAETIWAISPKDHLVRYCRQKALRLGFRPHGAGDSKNLDKIADASELWTREENAQMMEFLRQQPAHKFEATMVGDRSVLSELRIPITPVFDGELLPASIAELRAASPARRVMAGVSEFEGLLFLSLGLQKANRKFLSFCESRAFQLLNGTAKLPKNESDTNLLITEEEFRHHYGITKESRHDKRFVRRICVDLVSDLVTNFALENYCRKMTENGSTVWRYVFEHYNPNSSLALNPTMPFVGATHCTELIHLFDVNIFVVPFRRTSKDRRVHDQTTRLWANFAKYGDPNGEVKSNEIAAEPIKSAEQSHEGDDGAESSENIPETDKPKSRFNSVSSRTNRITRSSSDDSNKSSEVESVRQTSSDDSDDVAQTNESKNSTRSSTQDASNEPTFWDADESDKRCASEFFTDSGVSSQASSSFNSSQSGDTVHNWSDDPATCDRASVDKSVAYWPPYDPTAHFGYFAIRDGPTYRNGLDDVWQRARALASRVDRSRRYDN